MRHAYRRGLTVLAIGAVLATAAAVLAGGVGIVTTNGVSMNPTYYKGDLVIVTAEDRYSVGQVVAYRDHRHNLTVLHRIVGQDADGYVLKGDNNESIDAVHPTHDDLLGRAVLHIPHAGGWLRALTGPVPLSLAGLTLLAAAGAAQRRQRRRHAMARHVDRRNPAQAVGGALPPRLRTAAGGIAAVGVLGLALATVSWTHPAHTTAPKQQQQAESITFTYSAAVSRSAAYDGTTASSPGPVFRRLSNTVSVHFAYLGNPGTGTGTGTVTVDAELSAASGWRSTIRLTPPKTFEASSFNGAVRLDLSALEKRAEEAAAVTGLPTDPLTIAVVPRVTTADGASFAPPLRLTLTPLALTLADDPKGLTVTNPTTVSQTERVSATLSLQGRHITVATGRVIASGMLVLAALAGLTLAWVRRRTAPADEGAAIRTRYASLLLPVHPIPTPAGHTVIDVTTFATLAKLAEHHGLLVLHWSRSDVETFILHAAGTTYRYRAGENHSATATTPNGDEVPTQSTARAPSATR